jgi:hypothetical protein
MDDMGWRDVGQGFDTVVFPENLGFTKDASFDADGSRRSPTP